MTPLCKITRPLLQEALDDLERPHPFAFERLGFLSFRQSLDRGGPLLLCHAYHSIPDELYVRDDGCGARIGGDAIREAMSRTLRDGSGQLWIHSHSRQGIPWTSGMDRHEGPRVVQSCRNVNQASMHGWAVISEDGIEGEIQMPNGELGRLSQLTVVGYPMLVPPRLVEVESRGLQRPRISVRYDRQGFLGANAQAIFARSKIGIVGLGGGGSHVCQQMAHIGFQNLILCDEDVVEDTNLNRLIGATLGDVAASRYKTEIAADKFRQLQPLAELDDKPGSWEQKRGELRDSDLVIGCVDSFPGRRDLEAFCRAHLIPLIDIGMKVIPTDAGCHSEMFGQAAISLPGQWCLQCLQVLTADNLAEEAQGYGGGSQPQVVWPNGTLASTAVGLAVALLTGWAGEAPPLRLDYRGSEMSIRPSNILHILKSVRCNHYPLHQAGDPVLKAL